jgi:hypothetical protein
LYQVSSKYPKEFRRSCEDKVFFQEAKSRGNNSSKNKWTKNLRVVMKTKLKEQTDR